MPSSVNGRRALFVDLDGTVRETYSGRYSPIEPDDQFILPGVSERLATYQRRGFVIVGVTNQGGVAFGDLTEREVLAVNQHLTQTLLPGLFLDVLFCPHHPSGRIASYRSLCLSRKPGPAMAFEAVRRHSLDLQASVMVGDRDVDEGFARAAGIGRFFWSWEFFWSRGIGGDDKPAE